MRGNNKTILHFLTLSVSVLAISLPASAQNTEPALRQADPGRVEQQLPSPDFNLKDDIPDIRIPGGAAVKAPEGAENVMVTLREIHFEGVTVYGPGQLKPLYADKIGEKIALTEVFAIANELTLKYRNDGYVLTQVVVPPQTIDNGIVRLQVVEGFIDKVSVQGDESNGAQLVRDLASKLSNTGPVNIRELERSLLLINDLPGVSARSVLSPSRDVTGAADLTIFIDRDPYDGLVAADNYGSKYLGAFQTSGALTLNSPFGWNEAITIQAAVTPSYGDKMELGYVALGYSQPLNAHGTSLELAASMSTTAPGYTLEEFDVEGQSGFISVGLRQSIIRTRELNWSARLSFDARDVETKNNVDPITKDDRIRALRVGTRASFLDSFLGLGMNTWDLEISHGLDVFNSSHDGDADLSRLEAEDNFWKVEAEMQRLQRLYGPINLLVGVKGQWATDALYSSEEMGLGGFATGYGRGYDPSEISGDDAVAAKVEIQFNNALQFPFVETSQLYGFYDVGTVWNKDAATTDIKRDSIASTGVGTRFGLPHALTADLALAIPMTRDVETDEGGHDMRIFFSIGKSF
ncbi:MAG: BamA/TamA family outer membrane protein [Alphaproteobacteria bacterium]|nr:BamA/TamA family outer membrane protein [Alphaproteobacteria bacterium]